MYNLKQTAMKIELKNLTTFKGRQGIGISVTILIDGKKAIQVIDEANGGCLSYQPASDNYDLFVNSKKYLEAEAEKNIEDSFEKLDAYINNLINNELSKKEIKKLEKFFKDHLVFANEKGDHFKIPFKTKSGVKVPLINVLTQHIKDVIDRMNIKYSDFKLINNNVNI